MSERLFHLAPAVAWEAFVSAGDGAYRPPSLASEGFVHLSRADQLARTLRVHFAHPAEHDETFIPATATGLVLVELDPDAVASELRWEASRDGAAFPHLYGPIRSADVLTTWPLTWRNGAWGLPAGLEGRAKGSP